MTAPKEIMCCGFGWSWLTPRGSMDPEQVEGKTLILEMADCPVCGSTRAKETWSQEDDHAQN